MVTNLHATWTDIEKLGELIRDIKVAMLTTVEGDGSLRSRPMATQATPFDGTLWFFTRIDSAKVAELHNQRHVNVSYADVDAQKYVSVSGMAVVVRDKERSEALWHPILKAWFPGGAHDPDLALLRVDVTEAEYWDAPHGAVVKLASFLKAVATGERYVPGENKRVEVR